MVELDRTRIFPQFKKMTIDGKTGRLARLRHQVAYEDTSRFGPADGLAYAMYQKRRQKTCEKRSGADRDQIRVCDRLHSFRHRMTSFRLEVNTPDRWPD